MRYFSDTQLERYSRHFVLSEIGVAGQKRLLKSKVLVIGVGALGSSVLMYLAAAGVGTLGIVDFDKVELSNLQRQVIHRTDTVGMLKTISAKKSIAAINPDISVKLYDERITADNILPMITEYDFIIDGTDNFPTKFLINDACVIAAKPYSHAGIIRFSGQAMTYVPNIGPCLRCILPSVPSHDGNCSCSTAGVLGAATSILGSVQALEAIKFILDIGELLTGRVLFFDGLTMNFKDVQVHSDSDCLVCGEKPSIVSLADNTTDYIDSSCQEV